MSDFVIHICQHCGEKCGGVYCPACKTKEGREKVDEENAAIREENRKKGFVC